MIVIGGIYLLTIKVIFFTIFHYHLITHGQIVMHWNEICEENKIVEENKNDH